jgi:phosphoglycerate dehydrogenase-like enzyme
MSFIVTSGAETQLQAVMPVSVGFGRIGAATARLMHSIGMRVHAINRHGIC